MAVKYTYNEERKCWKTRVWDGTYDKNGNKHYKEIRSTKSSRDLENKVIEFKQHLTSTIDTTITFVSYARFWLDTYKAGLRINTKSKYSRVIETKFTKIEGVRLQDIKHSTWYVIIKDESPSTISEIWKVYKQVIEYAIRDSYLPKSAKEDLLVGIDRPKPKKPVKRALTPSETEVVKHIVDIPPMYKAYLWIIYGCGLRRSEALALTKEDITKDGIRVNKVLVFESEQPVIENATKSDNSLRTVPMPKFLKEYLDYYVPTVDNYLFTTAKGELVRRTTYKRMWKKITKIIYAELGYDSNLTAHIFRHNYCSTLCYQIPKISINSIAALMGDNPKTVIEIYNHIVEQNEDKIGAIESALG